MSSPVEIGYHVPVVHWMCKVAMIGSVVAGVLAGIVGLLLLVGIGSAFLTGEVTATIALQWTPFICFWGGTSFLFIYAGRQVGRGELKWAWIGLGGTAAQWVLWMYGIAGVIDTNFIHPTAPPDPMFAPAMLIFAVVFGIWALILGLQTALLFVAIHFLRRGQPVSQIPIIWHRLLLPIYWAYEHIP